MVTINAGAAAATLFGSHVDGDAGYKPSIWVTCYFDFSWEMAQEADCIAWRLWQDEQAAQKGKGKGKGRPGNAATIPQTFEV